MDEELLPEDHLLQKIARSKGGVVYKEIVRDKGKIKHLVQCNRGHQWYTRTHHLKRGAWCPFCYKLGLRYAWR